MAPKTPRSSAAACFNALLRSAQSRLKEIGPETDAEERVVVLRSAIEEYRRAASFAFVSAPKRSKILRRAAKLQDAVLALEGLGPPRGKVGVDDNEPGSFGLVSGTGSGVEAAEGGEEESEMVALQMWRQEGAGRGTYTLRVPGSLFARLFPHQREALRFLFRLQLATVPFGKGSDSPCALFAPALPGSRGGGFLADDMGMGKTASVVAYLCAALHSGWVRVALVAAPLSLLGVWEREFERFAPQVRLATFHCRSNAAYASVARVRALGGVILTTYSTLASSATPRAADILSGEALAHAPLCSHPLVRAQLTLAPLQSFLRPFDWVVMDEGHKAKNPLTATHQALRSLPATQRLILSGTPLQNHLRELHALASLACGSELLGSESEWECRVVAAVERATERGATDTEKRVARTAMQWVRARLAPHFLRRVKTAGLVKGIKKTQVVLWVREGELERKHREAVEAAQCSILEAISHLRTIATHPLLFDPNKIKQTSTSTSPSTPPSTPSSTPSPTSSPPSSPPSAPFRLEEHSAASLEAASPKVRALLELLERFGERRVVVFSRSRRMVEVVGKVLDAHGVGCVVVHGGVVGRERERRVRSFEEEGEGRVLVVTTGVGAHGLTVTSASCVVLLDVSWNPATDAQAVDRVFRIGQTEDVLTVRLVLRGGVEEWAYRGQLCKGSIAEGVVGGGRWDVLVPRSEVRSGGKVGPKATGELWEGLDATLHLAHPGRGGMMGTEEMKRLVATALDEWEASQGKPSPAKRPTEKATGKATEKATESAEATRNHDVLRQIAQRLWGVAQE